MCRPHMQPNHTQMAATSTPDRMRMCASGLLRPRRRTESTAPALWLPTDEEAKRLAQQLLRFRFGSGDDEDGEDGNDGEDCNDSEDGTDGREGNGSECHKGKGNG